MMKYMEEERLEAMAWEMALVLPSNHAEAWARIFHRIALVAQPITAAKCAWIAETIRTMMSIPPGRERLEQPVASNEALNMGLGGCQLSLETVVTLHCTIYRLEQELGADHVLLWPVQWYRNGLKQRARRLVNGQVGGNGESDA